MGVFKKKERLYYFFNPPKKRGNGIEEQRAIADAKDANRAVFERVGFRYILSRITEKHYFDGLGKTPDESARLAPIEDALAKLADENAQM